MTKVSMTEELFTLTHSQLIKPDTPDPRSNLGVHGAEDSRVAMSDPTSPLQPRKLEVLQKLTHANVLLSFISLWRGCE